MYRHIAIAGIPGSGKTTLAKGICEARGWFYLSTGDIARHVDPEAIARGELADEGRFREGFAELMSAMSLYSPIVLDGIPRSESQLELLPEGTRLMALFCRTDVARDRLMRRDREDDKPDIIEHRIAEQNRLLEGWLREAAGWNSMVNTTYKKPDAILRQVLDYIDGTKTEAF